MTILKEFSIQDESFSGGFEVGSSEVQYSEAAVGGLSGECCAVLPGDDSSSASMSGVSTAHSVTAEAFMQCPCAASCCASVECCCAAPSATSSDLSSECPLPCPVGDCAHNDFPPVQLSVSRRQRRLVEVAVGLLDKWVAEQATRQDQKRLDSLFRIGAGPDGPFDSNAHFIQVWLMLSDRGRERWKFLTCSRARRR